MVGELGIFATLVQNLNAMGFYGFILPWLLVFAVVYALLQKSKVLGGDKRIDGVIALAIAFFITGYTGIGVYFVQLMGPAVMIIAAILVGVLFVAVAGIGLKAEQGQQGETKFSMSTEAIIGAIIVGIVLFFAVGGSAISGISLRDDIVAGLFMIIVIVLAVWFISGKK